MTVHITEHFVDYHRTGKISPQVLALMQFSYMDKGVCSHTRM